MGVGAVLSVRFTYGSSQLVGLVQVDPEPAGGEFPLVLKHNFQGLMAHDRWTLQREVQSGIFTPLKAFPTEELVAAFSPATGPLEAYEAAWALEERFLSLGQVLKRVHGRFAHQRGDSYYEMNSFCLDASGVFYERG